MCDHSAILSNTATQGGLLRGRTKIEDLGFKYKAVFHLTKCGVTYALRLVKIDDSDRVSQVYYLLINSRYQFRA